MQHRKIFFFTLVGMLFIAACVDDNTPNNGDSDLNGTDSDSGGTDPNTVNGTDSDSGGTDPNTVCDVGDMSAVCANGALPSVALLDNNNYSFSSSLSISSVVVRGGSPIVDLTFDWSALNTDFMGHALNPLYDIEMVIVTAWNASQAEMKQMFDADSLERTKLLGAVMAYPNDQFTSDNLLNFTLQGTPITAPDDVQLRDSYFNADDPGYNPNLYTHMVLVQSNPITEGRDIRMIQFFTLDSTSNNTLVSVTNDSADLTYEVSLKNLQAVPMAKNNSAVGISWENLTLNAMGRDLIPTLINRVVVAHYSMSVCDLENQFLDVETIHDQWYESVLENVSTEHNLSMLKAADGTPFPGITDGGLWILALFCNEEKCSNPAPLFLTILQPC